MLTKIITLFVLARAIRGNILKSQLNYQKPNLERNNIINKGVWVRNKPQENLFDKTRIGNFIFRENSLDVENLVQSNFDPFGTNYMEDAPTVSNYIKRAKRAIQHIREQRLRKSLKNCIGKGCKTFIIEEQEEVGKEPLKLDNKVGPTSVFNDYPYEVAIFLNNNKIQINTPQNDTITLENDINENSNNLSKTNDRSQKPKLSVDTDFKENNGTFATNITSPKRSKKYDFESEIIKKIEFNEDMNKTQENNEHSKSRVIDRNIFDKDTTVWHQNAPIPNVNVYKVVPKEPQKSKTVTERGLIKVISMLTKTFKKIMRQHNEIKDIHERITDVNDQFVKNAGAFTTKFQDFDVKYLYMLKFYEKLKIFDAKLAKKQEYFKNKEREMANNFEEFENQQKKFLHQQRQFYNIQKLMLAQNENINAKQNIIAKTQSEISHRQNNFARILKKAKQLYLESRNPKTKISSNVIKPFHNPKSAVPKPQISTTTPSTESVKINLFSIPTSNKIENQDDVIIKEKDDQTIDDLVYKYYFNNTFIDNVMKKNVLTSLIGVSHSPGVPRNVKNKRNELETTILLPIYENNDSEAMESKNRDRRWINHRSRRRGKRRERGKGGVATILNAADTKVNRNKVINNISVVDEIPKVKDEGDIDTQNDPFLSMAKNFCNEIRQNANSQMLRWCVEKALRRLQFLDMNNVPTLAKEVPTITAPKTTLPPKPRKAHKHKEHTKLKPKANTILEPLITKLYTKAAIELNTVKTEQTAASTSTVAVTETTVTVSPSTEAPTSSTLATTKVGPVISTENVTNLLDGNAFFPDNEELESNLKQYDMKPDLEGNVYFEGSIHASDILDSNIDSQGMDDIMPGLESNSRVEMDPLAFDLQAQRRAIVRKLNEKIKMSLG